MATLDCEKSNQSPSIMHRGDASEEVQKQLAEKKDLPVGCSDLTPEELALNRRVNRKMDLAMLPVLSILYLFNGLDKGNVGNAETQGIDHNYPPGLLPFMASKDKANWG